MTYELLKNIIKCQTKEEIDKLEVTEMPLRYRCRECRIILAEDYGRAIDLISPSTVINKYGSKCSKCGCALNLNLNNITIRRQNIKVIC